MAENTASTTSINLIGKGYPYFEHVSSRRDGFDLNFTPVAPGESFKAVLEDTPFQVNEFSLASYTMMRTQGIDRMIAIPIFLNRDFRHGSLYVLKDSDLTHPSQLKGKSIGAREYTQTAAVWWRGTMIDEYDLHWTDVTWISGPVQRFTPPAEAKVQSRDRTVEDLFLAGEIDSYLAPNLGQIKNQEDKNKIRSIFPDTETEERAYYARTGIFPLNHAVVIHKDTLAANPTLPPALFAAYCDSKKKFYDDGGIANPWGDPHDDDPVQFGLTASNRTNVETLWRYLHEQKFIDSMPDFEFMFVHSAAAFSDHERN